MARINPYLTFNGNCEEAFLFYKSVFKSEFKGLTRFQDESEDIDTKMPDVLQKIMHVSLPLGRDTVLMDSDTRPMAGPVEIGQNMAISINVDSKEEAHEIFDALAKDGNVTMALSDAFWGAYIGMLTDKFGILWRMNYEESKE